MFGEFEERALKLLRFKSRALNKVSIFMYPPVDRNAAEVQDARRGKVNIQTVVHVAHERAEHPLSAGQLHGGVECHRAEGHQHVGHGQRNDKVIGYHPVNETIASEFVSIPGFVFQCVFRVDGIVPEPRTRP